MPPPTDLTYPRPTAPAPDALRPPVVLGHAVPANEKRYAAPTAPSAYADTEFDTNHSSPQFEISLYVDDIKATTPALVVWKFIKGAEVRLDQLSPLFKATRGFYGVLNNACTEYHRPYYAINVIRYASRRRMKRVGAHAIELTFHCHYDDDGTIRSRFDLTVEATHNGHNVVVSLGRMRLRSHGSHVLIGERDLTQSVEPARSRSLPSLMFTPTIFSSIARPDQSCLTWGSSRRLVDQVWSRLSAMNVNDWERYTLAKNRFAIEYARYIRAAQWDANQARSDAFAV